MSPSKFCRRVSDQVYKMDGDTSFHDAESSRIAQMVKITAYQNFPHSVPLIKVIYFKLIIFHYSNFLWLANFSHELLSVFFSLLQTLNSYILINIKLNTIAKLHFNYLILVIVSITWKYP